MFLAPDGGPRDRAIQLPEKPSDSGAILEESESGPQSPLEARSPPAGVIGSIGRKVSKKISGYLNKQDATTPQSPSDNTLAVPLAIPSARRRSQSRGSAYGSAYGYGASYRNRVNSVALNARRGSVATSLLRRRGSGAGEARPSMVDHSDLNFAQRLLLANENAVTNIADLWVASAINVENEEVFESESDTEEEGVDDSQVIEDDTLLASSSTIAGASTLAPPPNVGSAPTRKASMASLGFRRPQRSPRRPSVSTVRASVSGAPRRVLTPLGHPRSPEEGVPGSFGARRPSFVPAIFSNPGLRTPPALLDSPMQPFAAELPSSPPAAQQETAGLAPIMESRRVSLASPPSDTREQQPLINEKAPSLASQLPIAIIVQYGLLALHTTTHDQVFLSYLVS